MKSKPSSDYSHLSKVELLEKFHELEKKYEEASEKLDKIGNTPKNLQESQKLYHLLAENTSDLVCIHRPNGIYQYVSPSCKQLLGFEQNELVGTNPYDLFHPEDIDSIIKQSHNAAIDKNAEKRPESIVYRIRQKSGKYIWFETYTVTIKDEEGNISNLVTSSRDISARLQIEEDLKHELDKNKTLLEKQKNSDEELKEALLRESEIVKAGNVGLWAWDLKKNEVNLSREWKSQIGYEDHEIENDFSEWEKRVHPDDLENALAVTNGSIRDKLEHYSVEFRFQHKDGSYRWILAQASVFQNEAGEAIRALGTHIDVTELKKAEEILKRSEEFARSVFDGLSASICIIDKSGDIIAVNKAWKKFAKENGAEPKQVSVGINYLAVCDKAAENGVELASDFKNGILDVMAGKKESFHLEYPCHSTSEKRWFMGIITHMPGLEEQSLVVSHENITERINHELALKKSETSLTVRNKIAEIFLTVQDNEMYAEVLDYILEIMECKHGYFGYMENDDVLIAPSMTRKIWDKCQIPGKTISFPKEIWGGLWGRSLLEKKTLMSNNNLTVPGGHLSLKNALAVPIMISDQLIGQIVVGNKKHDFETADIKLLEDICAMVAPVLLARLQRDQREMERKEAEDELKRSEEKFRQLTENIQEVFWMTSSDYGIILYLSPAFERIWGRSVEDTYDNPNLWRDAIHPSDQQRVRKEIEKTRATGTYSIEYRINRPNGETRWIRERAFPILNNEGLVYRIAGISEDITQRKHNEAKMDQVIRDMGERIKELTCLYGVANAIRRNDSLESIFYEIINLIPPGWQHPEITKTCIEFDDKTYSIKDFKKSRFSQTSNIIVNGENRGSICVFLEEDKVSNSEQAFLAEEQQALDLIAYNLSEAVEKKHAEDALTESEYRYKSLIERMSEGLCVIDKSGIITFSNNSFSDMLEYPVEELIGKQIRELFDDNNRKIFKKQIALRPKGIAEPYEIAFRKKDGKNVPTITSPAPLFDLEDNFLGSFAVITDISTQKQVEKVLQDSKIELEQRVNERTKDLMISNQRLQKQISERKLAEKSLSNRYEELSSINHLITGITSSLSIKTVTDVAEAELKSLFHPDVIVFYIHEDGNLKLIHQYSSGEKHDSKKNIKSGSCLCGKAVQSKRFIYSEDVDFEKLCTISACRKSGVRSFAAIPLRGMGQNNDETEVIGVIGIGSKELRDFKEQEFFLETISGGISIALQNAMLYEKAKREIDERILTQKALEESEEQYRVVAETVSDILITFNDELKIEFINEAVREVLGYKPQELIGQNFNQIIRNVIAKDSNEVIDKKSMFLDLSKVPLREVEVVGLHKEGRLIPFEVSISEMVKKGTHLYSGIIRDLTQRKKAEANFKFEYEARLEAEKKIGSATQLVEQSARLASIGVMAAGITHEINQPLNAISVTTESILFWNKRNKGVLPDTFIDKLNKISLGTRRIDDIIQHLRSFWIKPASVAHDVISANQAIRSALMFTNRQMHAHGIIPEINLEEGSLKIEGNETQLEQIIINLVSNSIQALDDIDQLEKVITVTSETSKSHVIISIEDNGPGLPENIGDKIFDPFFSTKKTESGSGLGLAIVKMFVEKFKGTIKSGNNQVGGAKFVLSFPKMENLDYGENESTPC